MASATSSPLSSAPATPSLPTPRPPSHPATSPMQQHANSPRPPNLRRTLSAMSLGGRSTSSPKLLRKGSRQLLGAQAEEQEERPTPKRSISNLIANLREAQSTMESIEEPIPLTAAQIAMEHFARELATHSDPNATAETLVILHDACYGHRYSRLKATKSTLSMLVERPERIHASVLGASAAYVRLGEHYAGAKNAPHPERSPTGAPPFNIRRTARSIDITSSYVTNVHGTAWMSELQAMCHAAGDRLAAGAKELSRSCTPTEPEKRKLHEGDLYLAPESLDAFQGALGGVADAVDAVFEPQTSTKRAFVAIRPPGHHCSADYPSGFCWLNNVHVGIEYAAQTHGLTHAAILDFDLHHGDGSQAITWERNSRNNQRRLNAKPNSKLKLGPAIGYYSLHDINSYPCEMGDDDKVQAASLCVENAHGQSVWNVHLQAWKTESEFWELYESRYRLLLDKARTFLRYHTARLRTEGKVQPRAAVFISAGFDASEWESAGMQRHKVNVPTEFYARFTRDVVHTAEEEGSGCDGRVISVLEGGYSDRALCSGVLSHLSGLCATPADTIKQEEPRTMGLQLDAMMNDLCINGTSSQPHLSYDKTWWSAPNLTALEVKVNPPPPPQGKRVRTGPQPTYATPTESFAYKVVDPNILARSVSGTIREAPLPVTRPRTRPPPEVYWVVATQELSKLLIPVDRETRSWTAEGLGGVRKGRGERMSAAPLLTAADEVPKPRRLRERRGKVGEGVYAESAHSDEVESLRSVSRSSNGNRRQTMHEMPSSAQEETGSKPMLERRASRRLSAGSAFASLDGRVDDGAPPVPAVPQMSKGHMKRPPIPTPAAASGIQMKKMRAAPSKPPKAPSSTGSAQISAALSTIPSPTIPAPAPPNGTVASTPAATTAPSDDLEKLTSNMKKITLKVGSREESERKAKEREATERRARALRGAETRRINAAARKAAGVNGTATAPVSNMRTTPTQVPGAKVALGGSERGAVGLGRESEALSPVANGDAGADAVPTVPGAVSEDAVVPQEANDKPQPLASFGADFRSTEAIQPEPPQENLPSGPSPLLLQPEPEQAPTPPSEAGLMPPTTANKAPPPLIPDSAARQVIQENNIANGIASQQPTAISSSLTTMRSPSNNNKGNPLPIWSSTGPIPFAMPASNPKAPNTKSNPKSPNSPSKSPWRQGLGSGADGMGSGNGVSRTMLKGHEEEIIQGPTPGVEKAEVDGRLGMSIWEVPETPRGGLVGGFRR